MWGHFLRKKNGKLFYQVITLVILLLVVGVGFSLTKDRAFSPAPEETHARCQDLTFEDFPVDTEYQGPVASIDFSTNENALLFRTVISHAVAQGVNFAGSYVIASWGCGTSCQSHAIIDARDGSIVSYGLGSLYSVAMRKDSSLLIFNPAQNIPTSFPILSQNIETEFYVLHEGTLKKLCSVPSRFLFEENGGVCAQVITTARNPETGEVRDFPTPCDVPQGWEQYTTVTE